MQNANCQFIFCYLLSSELHKEGPLIINVTEQTLKPNQWLFSLWQIKIYDPFFSILWHAHLDFIATTKNVSSKHCTVHKSVQTFDEFPAWYFFRLKHPEPMQVNIITLVCYIQCGFNDCVFLTLIYTFYSSTCIQM